MYFAEKGRLLKKGNHAQYLSATRRDTTPNILEQEPNGMGCAHNRTVFISFSINNFYFYIISLFYEHSIQFLCSVDNIINLIRYVQESQQSPVYKNQNTNPVSFRLSVSK